MSATTKTTLAIFAAAVLFGVAACGSGELPEEEKKAFVTEFKDMGLAAEKALEEKYPDDEEARGKEFREKITALEGDLFAKYGVTKESAGEIFREARQKGWW